ncbi:hypothetical protein GCM10027416_15540 [Okibacterium endophyticum]
MSGDLGPRVLASSLPPAARARYLEEWHSDSRTATEAGLRRHDVRQAANGWALKIRQATIPVAGHLAVSKRNGNRFDG